MKKKRTIKILVLGSKEVVGLLEYRLNMKRFFTAKILSEHAKVYSLDKKVILMYKTIDAN